MPSLRNICLGLGLAAVLGVSSAAPIDTCGGAAAASPSLPVNGGTTELPAPGNATFKYVAVGRGIQNYTCAAANATPVAIGAVATLFDGSSLASTDPTKLDTFPALAVYQPVPTCSLDIAGDELAILGRHYFDIAGTPVFDLYTVDAVLKGKKTASIKAPATADLGPDNTGAVDWLQLQDKGGSVGITEVYRVVTAGGNPLACTAAGVISIPYASQYWFYEL
ncbi:malate dehydrogenase [Phlyctema vagabunda]|uniref:Malate dehydrogenase n=1 Tax=Phlyctema vagabunda TaxID=108571 RepID=A0ABR4PMJ8_9HELO